MSLAEIVYRAVRSSPLGPRLAHAYPYNFRPHQLAALLGCLDEAIGRFPAGDLVEVGCFAGHTTVFLGTHVAEVALGRRYHYHAYDTFGGFVDHDVAHEIDERALAVDRDQFDGFRRNDIAWVQQTIDRNAAAMTPVTLHKADASTHDFAEVASPVFALIDVDLYRPTMNALERLWPKMAPGAVVVLDDSSVDADGRPLLADMFSGGHAALLEFAGPRGIAIEYRAGKLAVIRR